MHLILASTSQTRATLLQNAGLSITATPPRIDEDMIKNALLAEGVSCRDLADHLAEAKAQKVSAKHPSELVLGCDQVLEHYNAPLSKPVDPPQAAQHLGALSGQSHTLLSAAVIYENGKPLWRHMGKVSLTMRPLSDDYIEDYVARNWHSIRNSVGAYKLEEEGARLFTDIQGDYFSVLGLPLLPLLSWLIDRGSLQA